MTKFKYQWFTLGDLNAFFALFLDNVVNLLILAQILIFGFKFPADVVYYKMIPGIALGVMVGDLTYTYMAFRLAKKTQKHVTAMPLGIDTPSTIGIAVAILGPVFLMNKASMGEARAADFAWQIGMAVMIVMALVKFITSFFGDIIQKFVPTAALLGSIAGIGLAFLSAEHFIDTMKEPISGLISLGLILFIFIAHYKLPFKIPGAAAAVILGAIAFYIVSAVGLLDPAAKEFAPPAKMQAAFPIFSLGALNIKTATGFLTIAIPFGFLTIIGGINVTESARLAGDDYRTRDILLTEAGATFAAGMFGGVSQSAPYIGHSAYKKMGARAGYTLLTALAIAIGGWFGLIPVLVEIIPKPAVAPILIFVGFEITALAYQMSPLRHAMGVTFALVPSILFFGYLKIKDTIYNVSEAVKSFNGKRDQAFNTFNPEPVIQQAYATLKTIGANNPDLAGAISTIVGGAMTSTGPVAGLVPLFISGQFPYLEALANGFIVTAMIWGAAVTFIIDKQMLKAMLTLMLGGLLSLFGIIHSATRNSEIYIPWLHPNIDQMHMIPYKFALAYAIVGIMLFGVSLISEKPEQEAGY